jgi:hypothetical protein
MDNLEVPFKRSRHQRGKIIANRIKYTTATDYLIFFEARHYVKR